MKPEATWGDLVQIAETAPENFRPNEIGSVCGMLELKTGAEATSFGQPLGTIMYLVEFPDGSAMEIPQFLIRVLEGLPDSEIVRAEMAEGPEDKNRNVE